MYFTIQQTRVEKLIQNGNWKYKHSSPMSNLSWCDLNNKGNLLEVHDLCPNPKCKGQKQITFTPS